MLMRYLGPTAIACVASALGACGGASDGKKGANSAVVQATARDVAMRHEPCDLQSKQRAVLDVDRDGRPDIIRVFEGRREVCRALDINLDGVVDVYIYYDEQGLPRRREAGFDRDKRPDEIQIFSRGVLIRKERETNNDEKIDTWDYYAGGRLVREERDATGDGYVDQWWTFNRPGYPKCAVVMVDADGDGKPDQSTAIDLCADQFGGPNAAPVPGAGVPGAGAPVAPAPGAPAPVAPAAVAPAPVAPAPVAPAPVAPGGPR